MIMNDFKVELSAQLARADADGFMFVEVGADDLHRVVGGPLAVNQHMAMCCDAMYEEQGADDEVTFLPVKRRGETLAIRYRLPR